MGFQINQVVVSGNLTRNPEVRTTPGGTVITSISIAHNERRRNQQSGDWRTAHTSSTSRSSAARATGSPRTRRRVTP